MMCDEHGAGQACPSEYLFSDLTPGNKSFKQTFGFLLFLVHSIYCSFLLSQINKVVQSFSKTTSQEQVTSQ
jgi:hypothetical protein